VSTDALLTLAAAVIAVLTLMSPEARADLRLRATAFSGFIFLSAFLILIGIKMTPVWLSLGLPVRIWRWGFDAETASFLTIIVATVMIVVRVGTFRLSPRRIGKFSELAERLLFAGKFSELVFLLERHFGALKRLVEERHVASRVRKLLDRGTRISVFIGGRRAGGNETIEEWNAKQRHLLTRLRRQIGKILPDHEERSRRAKRLLERVFLSESFVDYLSKARPDFALRILDVKVSFFSDQFLDVLIRAWMSDTRSVLFEETFQNQNLVGGRRYRFEPLNPILWYFFGDPYRAEPLSIYKPVGDFVSDELTRLQTHPSEDRHRAGTHNFTEEERWRSPIHLGIRIFEFWIGEELHRGSHWHGWLMYFESWTKGILRNLADLDTDVDHTREFPTGYHFLLWEMFWTMEGWIEDSTQIDQGLKSVKIDKVNMMPGSIAKSAIITTGTCIRLVVESDNVRPEFKGYLLQGVLRRYENVVGNAEMKALYERAVLEGGQRFGSVDAYHHGLCQSIPHVDHLSLYGEPGRDLLETLVRHVGC